LSLVLVRCSEVVRSPWVEHLIRLHCQWSFWDVFLDLSGWLVVSEHPGLVLGLGGILGLGCDCKCIFSDVTTRLGAARVHGIDRLGTRLLVFMDKVVRLNLERPLD